MLQVKYFTLYQNPHSYAVKVLSVSPDIQIVCSFVKFINNGK